MWIFVKRCKRAMLAVALVCCLVIAAALLIGEVNSRLLPLIVVFWLTMAVYPLVQMIWIRLRTGLWWHLLNAHADWIGISIVLGSLLYLMLYLLWPLVDNSPVSGVRIGYAPLVLIIVIPLFRSAFKSSTQTRARAERDTYGQRWLILSHLTFWDVLFLRIPHERV